MKKIPFFLLTPTLAMPLVAISCVNKDAKYYDELQLNSTFSVEKEDIDKVGNIFDQKVDITRIKNLETREEETVNISLWEVYSAIDAEIVKIYDGDTMLVRVLEKNERTTAFNVGDEIKIRIALIDTLEQNVRDVTEREKKLAHLDSEYVESILPANTRVRIISENWSDGSYDRKIGYLFFGENYEQNFSINMLANGWTLPRINNNELKNFITDYEKIKKSSIKSYLLPYIARAFNHGYTKQRGFYAKDGVNVVLNGTSQNIKFYTPMDLAKEYIAHGSSLMSDAYQFLYPFNIEKNNAKKFNNAQNNIYEFLDKVNNKK